MSNETCKMRTSIYVHVHAKTMVMMGVCLCVCVERGERGGGGGGWVEEKPFLTFTQVNSIVYM